MCKQLFAQKARKWVIFTCTEEGTGSMNTENKWYFLVSYGIRIVIKYVLGIFVLPFVTASFPHLFKICGISTEMSSIFAYLCISMSSLFLITSSY